MTNRQLPALSRAETRVLARLWDLGRASVQDVRHNLPGRQKVAYATVQTLLRRLEKKGYVTHDAEGKAHVFQPAVPRDAVVKRSVADFVDRLFGGDPVPLLLHLADHSGLDAKDIQRLRRLLEKNSA